MKKICILLFLLVASTELYATSVVFTKAPRSPVWGGDAHSYELKIKLTRTDGGPVNNQPISWIAPAGGGYFIYASTTTNSSGEGTATWKPGTDRFNKLIIARVTCYMAGQFSASFLVYQSVGEFTVDLHSGGNVSYSIPAVGGTYWQFPGDQWGWVVTEGGHVTRWGLWFDYSAMKFSWYTPYDLANTSSIHSEFSRDANVSGASSTATIKLDGDATYHWVSAYGDPQPRDLRVRVWAYFDALDIDAATASASGGGMQAMIIVAPFFSGGYKSYSLYKYWQNMAYYTTATSDGTLQPMLYGFDGVKDSYAWNNKITWSGFITHSIQFYDTIDVGHMSIMTSGGCAYGATIANVP